MPQTLMNPRDKYYFSLSIYPFLDETQDPLKVSHRLIFQPTYEHRPALAHGPILATTDFTLEAAVRNSVKGRRLGALHPHTDVRGRNQTTD